MYVGLMTLLFAFDALKPVIVQFSLKLCENIFGREVKSSSLVSSLPNATVGPQQSLPVTPDNRFQYLPVQSMDSLCNLFFTLLKHVL